MKAKDIEAISKPVIDGIEKLANLISDLPDEFLGPVFNLTKRIGKAASGMEAPLKERVKALVISKGRSFTDAGSKVFDLSGWRMEIRPSGGGLNRDKFFAMLRTKDIKRIEACDMEKVYTPNKDLINQLIGAGRITQKDYDRCKDEPGFSVQTPEQIKDGDNGEG